MKRNMRLMATALLAAATIMPALANATLTLFGNTHLSNTIPINNVYLDEVGTRTQVLFPASYLSPMTGEVINSVTFYTDSPITVSGGSIQVSLGETSKPNYTDVKYVDEVTPVATITMVEGATEIEIVFDTPYYYKGGNLVIETMVTEAASSYCYITYVGERPDNYNAITRGQLNKFLPRTSFNYGTSDDYSAKVLPLDVNFKTIRAQRENVQTVTVFNTGNEAFTPSFSTDAPFIVPTTGAEIPAGGTLDVPVAFAPTSPGDYTGTLTVNCGEAGLHQVTLRGTAIAAATDLVVGDSTDYASYVPIYGTDIDIVGTQGQMIYPESRLREMIGSRIVGLHFHVMDQVEMDGGEIQLSLKVVNDSAFANAQAITELTTVARMSPVMGSDEFVFYFDQPFEYQGGHLLVDCKVTVAGNRNYDPTYFYGSPVDYPCSIYNSLWYNGFSAEYVYFMPAATFAYQLEQAVRGDVNGDGQVDIADATLLIDYLIEGSEGPASADCDLNDTTDIADATTLIDYLLTGVWQ